VSVLRRILGDLLLWTGILAGTAAIALHLLILSVLTPGRLTQQARALMTSPAIQRALADSLTNAIEPIAAAQGFTLTPAQAESVIHTALDSPAVQADFLGAMTTAQNRLLGRTSAPVVIGGPAFTQAVAAGLASINPGVAHAVASEDLAITIPGADVPSFGFVASHAPTTERTLLDLTLLAFVLALVLHPNRRHALAKIGVWLVGCSVAEVALFWFLPREVLPRIGFSWAKVAAVILSVTGAATVTFFLELLALGLGAIAVARGVKSVL